MSDPLLLAKFELAENIIGQNSKLVEGKSVCIDCGREEICIAGIDTAWVMCGVCGTCTGMFVYRGAKQK